MFRVSMIVGVMGVLVSVSLMIVGFMKWVFEVSELRNGCFLNCRIGVE